MAAKKAELIRSLNGVLNRMGYEGAAASFVDLTADDFRRLKALVDRRAGSA